MLVIVANEPRAYREAFAGGFAAVRPHIEIITVEPDALDSEASRLRPDLVLGNQLTPTVKAVARFWIELHEENGMLVASSNVGALPTDANVEFGDFVSIIDRTEERLRRESLRRGKAGPVR